MGAWGSPTVRTVRPDESPEWFAGGTPVPAHSYAAHPTVHERIDAY
jgi:hypothetical protein